MRIADLSLEQLRARLSHDGLLLPCGPFCIRLRTPLPKLAAEFRQLYADFPVLEADTYVDFEIEVRSPSPLRRFFRAQVIFDCDGRIPFKPLPFAQAFPILEWGLNWVIYSHAHDYLVMHAAVVERGGRCLMLAADPGSGKSTLCAALVLRGWRLLSDEMALISLKDGLAYPIARPVSLKNTSIDIVRALSPDTHFGPLCPDTAKGAIAHMRPPLGSVQAMAMPARPAMLVFPKYQAGAALQSSPEGQAHALAELTRHTFNFAVLGGRGFNALGRLIDQVHAHRIAYASFDQVIPEIERLWTLAPERPMSTP
ncbi:HprK-related kinase A [Roseateles koreensis]|uniref:HprK-related kinase A n=1 Tax=Roseateles koreensis TaxID=2987526 RepID=A0ABT5KQZ2_9BURK|nr:HprK-related kinase A [Roseateles koreensis]MDC8784870.1 HprK-related kinase A [Roseateles koreensis]